MSGRWRAIHLRPVRKYRKNDCGFGFQKRNDPQGDTHDFFHLRADFDGGIPPFDRPAATLGLNSIGSRLFAVHFPKSSIRPFFLAEQSSVIP